MYHLIYSGIFGKASVPQDINFKPKKSFLGVIPHPINFMHPVTRTEMKLIKSASSCSLNEIDRIKRFQTRQLLYSLVGPITVASLFLIVSIRRLPKRLSNRVKWTTDLYKQNISQIERMVEGEQNVNLDWKVAAIFDGYIRKKRNNKDLELIEWLTDKERTSMIMKFTFASILMFLAVYEINLYSLRYEIFELREHVSQEAIEYVEKEYQHELPASTVVNSVNKEK